MDQEKPESRGFKSVCIAPGEDGKNVKTPIRFVRREEHPPVSYPQPKVAFKFPRQWLDVWLKKR